MNEAMPAPDSLAGLTSAEAARRLQADGPNELPRSGGRSSFRIALDVLREPMLALLLAGGLVYVAIGDLREALVLLGFAVFSVAITIVQEVRSEHVLEALRDLSAPRALVIRDGKRVRTAGREVVAGDHLVLEQGDRVAADAMLLWADDLQVDESLLTGESLHVTKSAGPVLPMEDRRPGGEGQPFVYSGTLVVRGSGIGRVTATGAASEMGRIGQSLAALEPTPPRLRFETARIVRLCALGGAAISLAVMLLYFLTRGGALEALLAGIAIGMSVLPEEFAVVLTVFFAMGAWRIAHAGVLTRRPAAIETLGSATVLCTDKTGTLTENRMSVASWWTPPENSGNRLDGPMPASLIETAARASAPLPVDPMEIAFHDAWKGRTATGDVVDAATLDKSYGLRPDLLAMSNAWRQTDGSYRIAAKGAPEAIAGLCHLDPAARLVMTDAVERMAGQGMRVLAVADADWTAETLPERQTDFAFRLVGLVGLADPLRAAVPAAVAECRRAGIRVLMITGDYPATAQTIAAQAGIDSAAVLTGEEMRTLSDAALADRLAKTNIFARIMPEQKLRLVEALQAKGEIVAMTGDGVNDAPSLKAASIGIAMGGRGTDVAREASTIVLLDDDFGSIVHAIRLGRRIYDNLRKAMAFIFAVHVPIAGMALLPLLFGTPLLLAPIHIAILEMIIDPVCALVFEAEREEGDIMDRPPRNPSERLFSPWMVSWSIAQGSAAFVAVAAVWLVGRASELPDDTVRGMVFVTLLGAVVMLIVANATFRPGSHGRHNPFLPVVVVAVGVLTAVGYGVESLRRLLAIDAPDVAQWLIATTAVGTLFVVLQGLKDLARRRGLMGPAPATI